MKIDPVVGMLDVAVRDVLKTLTQIIGPGHTETITKTQMLPELERAADKSR